MTVQQSDRVVFLDYLRIFAFASVLIGHKYADILQAWAADRTIHITIRFLISALNPLYFEGGAGVAIFFMISGYLIPSTLRNITVAEFAIKRVFRIYPLYVSAVLIEALFAWFSGTPNSVYTTALQLTLLGDFFDVPYSLGSVEWTLRIELLFYVYMGILKGLGFLNTRIAWLPMVLSATLVSIFFGSPFPGSSPSFVNVATGLVTCYAPLLLLGTFVWAREQRVCSIKLLLASQFAILVLFCLSIDRYRDGYSFSHYGLAALTLFWVTYLFRGGFQGSPAVRRLSEVTFSVYLFHNWLPRYFEEWLGTLGMAGVPLRFLSTFALLIVCWAFTVVVERWGIRLGRRLIRSFEHSSRGEAPSISAVPSLLVPVHPSNAELAHPVNRFD